jgi:hypothetical protein
MGSVWVKEFRKNENITQWKDIGYVGNSIFTLNTIYWPGYTIFGPVENVNPLYRVVTRHAEPFVFITGPVEGSSNCYSLNGAVGLMSHIYKIHYT